jgi:hypothetical protein
MQSGLRLEFDLDLQGSFVVFEENALGPRPKICGPVKWPAILLSYKRAGTLPVRPTRAKNSYRHADWYYPPERCSKWSDTSRGGRRLFRFGPALVDRPGPIGSVPGFWAHSYELLHTNVFRFEGGCRDLVMVSKDLNCYDGSKRTCRD